MDWIVFDYEFCYAVVVKNIFTDGRVYCLLIMVTVLQIQKAFTIQSLIRARVRNQCNWTFSRVHPAYSRVCAPRYLENFPGAPLFQGVHFMNLLSTP